MMNSTERKDIGAILAGAVASNPAVPYSKRVAHQTFRFKRETIGFFGFETTLSAEDFAARIYNAGVAKSLEEARDLAPRLAPGVSSYSIFNVPRKLLVDAVKRDGKTEYKLELVVDLSEKQD